MPQRKWFEHYSKRFNTLELNTTFYRFPQVRILQQWYDNSPQIYRFSLKVPRLITHYKQLKDCERLLSDFYGTTREGLKDKLGCVLFQFSNRTIFSEAMLERIITNLDPSFTNVVEFRHDTWWQNDVFEKLALHNIHFCSISYPILRDDVIHNTKLLYYRFHGVPRLYKSTYRKMDILRIAGGFTANEITKDLFVYFNNTWGTGALKNSNQLLNSFEEKAKKNIIVLQKSL